MVSRKQLRNFQCKIFAEMEGLNGRKELKKTGLLGCGFHFDVLIVLNGSANLRLIRSASGTRDRNFCMVLKNTQ